MADSLSLPDEPLPRLNVAELQAKKIPQMREGHDDTPQLPTHDKKQLALDALLPARYGDSDNADKPKYIAAAQAYLSEKGFGVPVTGGYFDMTKTALGAFQQEHDLPHTRKFDRATISKMVEQGFDMEAYLPVAGVALQLKQEVESIQSSATKSAAVQSFLKDKGLGDILGDSGANNDGVDGVPAKNTARAMATFQKRHGISPSGTLDSDTLVLMRKEGFDVEHYTRQLPDNVKASTAALDSMKKGSKLSYRDEPQESAAGIASVPMKIANTTQLG